MGPDGDYSSAYARLLAPAYQNSNTDCQFKFYYYFNGSAGGSLLEIGRQEDELDIPLDFIHLDEISEARWYLRIVGLGRIPGHIQACQITFTLFEKLKDVFLLIECLAMPLSYLNINIFLYFLVNV